MPICAAGRSPTRPWRPWAAASSCLGSGGAAGAWARRRGRFRQPQGGPARRIFLMTMMGLDDLDIVVAQGAGGFLDHGKQKIHAKAHVGRPNNRNMGGGFPDGLRFRWV